MENTTGLALLNIGGKERPIYFGFMQTRIFCELKEIEYYDYTTEINKAVGLHGYTPDPELPLSERVQELTRRMDFIVFADLIYSALVAGCKHPDYRQEHKQDFTHDDVMFWVEQVYKDPDAFATVYLTLVGANKSPNVETQEASRETTPAVIPANA